MDEWPARNRTAARYRSKRTPRGHNAPVPETAPPPTPDEPLLSISGLRVTLETARGPAEALRGIDLRLERGGTLGLIGESGCGKSMTAMAIMGLLPTGARVAGSIRLDGTELVGADEPTWCALRGNRIGMVFQEPMTALNPLHTVGAQIAEPLRLHRGLDRSAARAEALRLLERVRMPQAAQRRQSAPTC
jgi:peptide/nickel transport system ATP-binding protein